SDYIEEVSNLLGEHSFDILFGNLRRTGLTVDAASHLMRCSSSPDFQRTLTHMGAAASPHWSVRAPAARLSPLRLWRGNRRASAITDSKPDAAFDPTPHGFHQFPEYEDEDVYLMSRRFAERHNWFLKGHHLYFEDIHFCQQPGVCELGPILAKLTR